MLKRTLVFVALLTAARSAAAVPPPAAMYADAQAQEQTVRAAMGAIDAMATMLGEVRAAARAYEQIPRHYPSSGYSDNALWQAGRLLLDAYARFGQTQDRDNGVKLLKRLAANYPTSKLAKQAQDQIAPFGAVADAKEAPAPPAPAADITKKPADDVPATRPVAGDDKTPAQKALATIKDIRREVMGDAVRVTIEIDGEVTFHQDRIPDPSRVFLDFSSTRAAPPLVDKTLRFESDADIVRQVRIGRHPNNTTRVVLDAAGVATYSVYALYEPYRIVVDCVRERAATAAAPQPAVVPAANVAPPEPMAAPAAAPPPPSPAIKLMPEPVPIAPLTPIVPPPRRATPGFSMARQLGLGVSRIVIDPGHGGHDPGAKGHDVTEADVVLDVALRLEKLLQKSPGVEVILTRRTDEFIALPERTAIANREGADLFLSIHANASTTTTARGIESYFLNFANNLSAAKVAARENAASGQVMADLPEFLKAIALNNKLDESRDFARHVQNSMVDRLRPTNKAIRDLGVKQAPFVVLIGAAMPSVLAEISFVTNPQEAKLLKGNTYRQRIAEGLFNAIQKYQAALKTATAVAPQ